MRAHSVSIHLKEGVGLNKCLTLKGEGRVGGKVNLHLKLSPGFLSDFHILHVQLAS